MKTIRGRENRFPFSQFKSKQQSLKPNEATNIIQKQFQTQKSKPPLPCNFLKEPQNTKN